MPYCDLTANPLVSVLIRSIDRPTLVDALASVAAQTWGHIEVIVVNAKGPGHVKPTERCGQFPLLFIDSDTPLHRGRAANIALDHARGNALLFLDDDDVLLPHHIASLVDALQTHPDAPVAYSAVRLEDDQGNALYVFQHPFDAQRLRVGNFIPIHAALFRRRLLDLGTRIDETLDFCEDWDFWLQASRHGEFTFVPVIGAIYRVHAQQGFSTEHSADQARSTTLPIYRKWLRNCDDDLLYAIGQKAQQGYLAQIAEQAFDDAGIRGGGIDGKAQQAVTIWRKWHELEALVHEVSPTAGLAGAIHDYVETRQIAIASTAASGHESLALAVTRLIQANAALELRLSDSEAAADSARQSIAQLKATRSWRVTKPMRAMGSAVRALKDRVGASGPAGQAAVRIWNEQRRAGWVAALRQLRSEMQRQTKPPSDWLPVDTSAGLIDLAAIPPWLGADFGRVAVHMHLFYADMLQPMMHALAQIPVPFDLFVSVVDIQVERTCKKRLRKLRQLRGLRVEVVPNRGRDLAPFFVTFGATLLSYDLVAHIHSKKSLHAKGEMAGWSDYLFNALMGSEDVVRRILGIFAFQDDIGIVYPQNYHRLPYLVNTWLANRACGMELLDELEIPLPESEYFDFPAGSMFWIRSKALAPLLSRQWKLEDFPVEMGQNDGTIAHALERLLAQAGQAVGLRAGVLADHSQPNWSPWRIDQYFSITPASREAMFNNPDLRLVVFDIFDTLLTRPLLHAEAIKQIVAARGGAEGAAYLANRHRAEAQARSRLGRDVELGDICRELVTLGIFDLAQAERLQILEKQVEAASVAPRHDVVEVYRAAQRRGLRVALASDTFLPEETITRMLESHGINGWDALYISNACNARKDSGAMYSLILEQEKLEVHNVLMVGDNERADAQIPGDLGMRTAHVMRPADMAMALPRWRQLLQRPEARDLDWQLTLGLVVRRFFGDAFLGKAPPRPDDFTLLDSWGVGYAVVGPMIGAFAQWLYASALRDGSSRLLFLAREGELLKLAYDRLAQTLPNAPESDYLVVSRRAVTVARLREAQQLLALAKSADYHANSLTNFLLHRFGFALDAALEADLDRLGLWPLGKKVEVAFGHAEHLAPMLDHIAPGILRNARDEREALMSYLDTFALSDRDALVDVGYSGTIQDALSELLRLPLSGHYMMTRDRIMQVTQRHKSRAHACFGSLLNAHHKTPAYWLHSFEVEQMLSSDSPQVTRYRLDPDGRAMPEYQPRDASEIAAEGVRAKLRAGALAFIDDVVQVRRELHPEFVVQPDCAEALFATWCERPSARETAALRELVLDDRYCGRGVVAPMTTSCPPNVSSA